MYHLCFLTMSFFSSNMVGRIDIPSGIFEVLVTAKVWLPCGVLGYLFTETDVL